MRQRDASPSLIRRAIVRNPEGALRPAGDDRFARTRIDMLSWMVTIRLLRPIRWRATSTTNGLEDPPRSRDATVDQRPGRAADQRADHQPWRSHALPPRHQPATNSAQAVPGGATIPISAEEDGIPQTIEVRNFGHWRGRRYGRCRRSRGVRPRRRRTRSRGRRARSSLEPARGGSSRSSPSSPPPRPCRSAPTD